METPGLRDRKWEVSYSHEDGELVSLFFVPALERAVLYQRTTGYFSGDVLALAARGLDALIRRGGRMQLLVGCTLGPDDIEQIEKGYDVREAVARAQINKLALVNDLWARERIGWVAWAVAHGHLDVKLAVPLDKDGKMRAGLGLYHAKMGVLTDEAGDRLVFKGSINETPQGWLNNCESFDVNCSWEGGKDLTRVERNQAEFDKLWSGKARSALVLDFPEAMRQKLLEYLPQNDTFTKPPISDDEEDEPPAEEPKAPGQTDMERMREAWAFIAGAAKRPDGAMVAVATSAVEPWPHQLRAYKRMLDNWPFRLLIADEVGLGKTIEAGLMIRHAWISGLAKRILILTPAGILKQWQAELYEKFNLLVPIYTGNSLVWPEHHFRTFPLEQKIDRKDWTKQPLVLASSHLMRRRDRQSELLEAEGWDLLLLDEAHHARRGGVGTKKEKGPNRLLRLMLGIREKAKALLLMTATPMQVHPVELWDLLNLLGLPDKWPAEVFVRYFDELGKNPDAEGLHQQAVLFQEVEKTFGPLAPGEIERVEQAYGLSKIESLRVLKALREPTSIIPLKHLSAKHRKAAVAMLKVGSPVRHRMSRHTRNLLREYFKKGLIDSPMAERQVKDVAIKMAPAERELYEAVEDYISDTYQAAAKDKKTAVGFVMTVYRRRLASSFAALRQTLQDRYARLDQPEATRADELRLEEDLPQDERQDEALGLDEAAGLEAAALNVEEKGRIQDLLKKIAKLGTDTKARVLLEELQAALADGFTSAIVFTQYTDTMDYLKEYLAGKLNLRMGSYSARGGERRDSQGAWVACSKEEIKRLLRESKIEILVCTDAASEGLNLQSCGVLVNADLPWNPMKVEQRIGRIDRIGQKHPTVRIVNLAYAGTVEEDIYFVLGERINLFRGVVGKMQPIQSRIAQEFEAATLRARSERERGRYEARHNLEVMIESADDIHFDIDEVSEADLKPPDMPPSPLKPEQINAVLANPALLPPGVECSPLEPQTYSLQLPGQKDKARVTASPAIFDDHFESHQMVAPDSPVFRKLVELAALQV